MLYYSDPLVSLHQGDALSVLRKLPSYSVDMAMTSPPFYSMRSYKVEPLIFGGNDPDCQHEWGDWTKAIQGNNSMVRGKSEINPRINIPKYVDGKMRQTKVNAGQFCSKCFAWRGVLGMEPSPDCGRPYVTLRDDLTPREREYVLGELKKCGLI